MLELESSNIDLDLLKAEVSALNIRDKEDNIKASKLLGRIKATIEEVSGRRDAVISEYEQRIADTRSDYQPLLSELESLKATVKTEMLSYRERAKVMLNQIKSDLASGKIERSDVYLDENGKFLNESALSIRTNEGLSSVRKYYKITVNDISQIPDDYKIIDKKALRAAARKGIKNIPGVVIEEKEAIQMRISKVA